MVNLPTNMVAKAQALKTSLSHEFHFEIIMQKTQHQTNIQVLLNSFHLNGHT